MKPAPFFYHRPESLNEALELLQRYGDEAKVIAGGVSLVPMLNMRLARPTRLIDINRLPNLDRIEPIEGGLRIGALVRQRRLLTDPLVSERAPLLREAARHIGHAPIRARGTVVGSIVHADPAAELPVALVALEGTLRVASAGHSREIPARELYITYYMTSLSPDELATHVDIPAPAPRSAFSFAEFARRKGDFALVSVACVLVLEEDYRTIGRVRLVFGGVDAGPVDVEDALMEFVGRSLSDAVLQQVAEAAASTLDPPGDLHASSAFRSHLARELSLQALRRAAERGGAVLVG